MSRKAQKAEHYFAEHPKSKPELGLVHARLRGLTFEFLTASGVFSKQRVDLGTRLLVDSMVLPERGCILDVGCGYGVIGIVAAALRPEVRVVMVDVNARAVRLARKNIETNSVYNVEVRRGNLYEPAKDMSFNCILSNPPVSAGMETVKTLICEAPEHMEEKARFQMVVRSKIAGNRLQSFLKQAFGNSSVLARESGYRVLIAEKR